MKIIDWDMAETKETIKLRLPSLISTGGGADATGGGAELTVSSSIEVLINSIRNEQ